MSLEDFHYVYCKRYEHQQRSFCQDAHRFRHHPEQHAQEDAGKGDDEATLTIKLVLTLDHEDGYDSDSQCEDDAHDVIKPSVQHKITSVLTTKSNTSGETKGDDALYWDKESGMYVTRPFLGAQTSMFDADKKADDDKIEGMRSSLMDDDAHEQLSLDGRAPAPQLTAPSDDSANANDDAIDADFHDISEDDCYTVENLTAMSSSPASTLSRMPKSSPPAFSLSTAA